MVAIEEARENARERLESVLTGDVLDALVVVLCLAGLPSVRTDEAKRRLRPALNKLAGALGDPDEVSLRERVEHLEAYVGTLVEGTLLETDGDPVPADCGHGQLVQVVRELEILGGGVPEGRVEIAAESFRKMKRLVGLTS